MIRYSYIWENSYIRDYSEVIHSSDLGTVFLPSKFGKIRKIRTFERN